MTKILRTASRFWDLEEREKKSFEIEALLVFKRILYEMDTTGFTFREVRKSSYWLTSSCGAAGEDHCPKQAHLRALVEADLLRYDPLTKKYAVREEAYFFFDSYDFDHNDSEPEELEDELGIRRRYW